MMTNPTDLNPVIENARNIGALPTPEPGPVDEMTAVDAVGEAIESLIRDSDAILSNISKSKNPGRKRKLEIRYARKVRAVAFLEKIKESASTLGEGQYFLF